LPNNKSGNLVLGIILVALGCIAGFFGYRELEDINSLIETGEQTQATVIKVDYLSPSKQGDQGQYIPIVQWQSKQGKNIEVRANLSSPKAATYRVGNKLNVIYDPDNPNDRYYVAKQGQQPKPRITDYVTLIIGIVFGLGGLLFIRESRKG